MRKYPEKHHGFPRGRAGHQSYAFEHSGFSAFTGRPDPLQGHRHNEVELAIFEGNAIVAFYNARQFKIPTDHLVVLWGAMPHQALKLGRKTVGHGIRVPLAWVLQWTLPENLVQRLMNLEVVVCPRRTIPCPDLALVKNWVALMRQNMPEAGDIVLLEVQARLRRIGMDLKNSAYKAITPSRPLAGAQAPLFERILEVITEQYRQPLSISTIAQAIGGSRNHMMRVFRKFTGKCVMEYITEQRISWAQRLLATTDMKILPIAFESGFSAPSRFYEAFVRIVGQSPARYRRTLQRPFPCKPKYSGTRTI